MRSFILMLILSIFIAGAFFFGVIKPYLDAVILDIENETTQKNV
jgi:hypothetical protein